MQFCCRRQATKPPSRIPRETTKRTQLRVSMLIILHEDDDLIALAKPAGLSTQAPEIAGESLQALVMAHLNPEAPGLAYLGTTHRLDRPVSGVVVWAKNERAARILSRQFEARRVTKTYWALVEGSPGAGAGFWEDWLVREDTGLGRVQVCRPGTPRAQLAVTRYQKFECSGLPQNTSWLVLTPETGRTHQLRVQCSERQLPIWGDAQYGSPRSFAPGTIALHACSITVRHPGDGRLLTIAASVPLPWLEFGQFE